VTGVQTCALPISRPAHLVGFSAPDATPADKFTASAGAKSRPPATKPDDPKDKDKKPR
jgi:hypothetical protein